MTYYEPKQIAFDAVQYSGENFEEVRSFLNYISMIRDRVHREIEIRVYRDPEHFDAIFVKPGEWVYKNPTGRIITATDADFRASFTAVG